MDLFLYVKLNFKAGLCFDFFDLRPPSLVNRNLKKMARANGKMTQKYQKYAKWLKITFRGPILVPVRNFLRWLFGGFGG